MSQTTAAMRHERNHSFPGEVISGGKRSNRRSNIAPPIGRTDKDNVVLSDIVYFRRQIGTESILDLLFGHLGTSIVVLGISLRRLNLEQGTSCFFPNLFRNKAGISTPGLVGNQNPG